MQPLVRSWEKKLNRVGELAPFVDVEVGHAIARPDQCCGIAVNK